MVGRPVALWAQVLAAHLVELDVAEPGVLLQSAQAAQRMTAEEAVPL